MSQEKIENDLWEIEWSRDRLSHVTSNIKVVTPIRLEPNISKTVGNAL